MRFALELMQKIKAFKNKAVVLGDMFELGDDSVKLHSELGRIIKRNKIDLVLTTGELMKNLDAELKKLEVESIHFDDRKELAKYLEAFKFAGFAMLVKGSRGMHMEEFSKIIETKAQV
jgi:UDP-N-acetylmuramoyl-tripeptide--D-alanyl-D-alanine ligase